MMARNKKNKKKSGLVTGLLLLICLLLAVDGAMLFLIRKDRPAGSEAAQTQPTQTEGTETAQPVREETAAKETTLRAALEFPYVTDDGMLQIDSLFQYTGMNPDFGLESGEDIAGIQITNISGKHLEEAVIGLEMGDGTSCSFLIRDLPAGKSATVFSVENQAIRDTEDCIRVECSAAFADESPLMAGQLRITVEGTTVTVENLSGDTMNDLTVSCHCVMETGFFGGTPYRYSLGTLGDGESKTIDAIDCFFGAAEVVRIVQNAGLEG